MHGKPSTLVFAIVAVVALGSTIVTKGVGSGARGRFDEALAKLSVECKEMTGPCDAKDKATIGFADFKRTRDEIDAADVALRAGDRALAVSRLSHVLERAETIDRQNSLVSSIFAGRLIEGVAGRIDTDPSLLDDARLASAIRRTSFASARHPLAAERLHALARISRVPAQVPVPTGGFAEAKVTEAMDDVDRTLRQMDASVVANDLRGCEAAAQAAKGLAGTVTVGPGICQAGLHVAQVGERLERLRTRAVAQSPQPRTAARRL